MAERLRVLHVASEIYPLVKTGGLADVVGALPLAQARAGVDVRVLVPGYPAMLDAMEDVQPIREDANLFHGGRTTLWVGKLRGLDITAYVLESPWHWDRPGNPYHDADGHSWDDNSMRYAALSFMGAEIGMGIDRKFRPDIVHCHDWQTGLCPAYLMHRGGDRPATVTTIHNLGYQGRFDSATFAELSLPPLAWGFGGVEHWGDVGYLKSGLAYSDRITTVSRTYAEEIQGPGGQGLEGLLRYRRWDLRGIVNGIDMETWDPSNDPALPVPFDLIDLSGKAEAKKTLQRRFGLREEGEQPLIGLVSRLTHDKGIDLLLGAVDRIVARSAQLVVLGSGHPHLEDSLRWAASTHPGHVGVHIGYDEQLAHLVMAGSDVVAVPSRVEPCGLTQLYAQRYGALPLVRRTGGLADTVVNASPSNRADGTATGFVFDDASAAALRGTIDWLADHWWMNREGWKQMQRRAMTRDFSWDAAARSYLDLYEEPVPGRLSGARRIAL